MEVIGCRVGGPAVDSTSLRYMDNARSVTYKKGQRK